MDKLKIMHLRRPQGSSGSVDAAPYGQPLTTSSSSSAFPSSDRPVAPSSIPVSVPGWHNQQHEGQSASGNLGLNINNLDIPSSTASHVNGRGSGADSPSSLKRKPVPVDASSRAARYQSQEYPSPARTSLRFSERSASISGPKPDILSPPPSSQFDFQLRNLDEFPHGETPTSANSTSNPLKSRYGSLRKPSLTIQTVETPKRVPGHGRTASTPVSSRIPIAVTTAAPFTLRRNASVGQKPNMAAVQNGFKSDLRLRLDPVGDQFEGGPALKRSPSQKLTSFFGWKSNSQPKPVAESPSTQFSDNQSLSPASPLFARNTPPQALKPSALDIPRANAMEPSNMPSTPSTPSPGPIPVLNAHIEELERELKEVSGELADSIKREMELEDEVERWRLEHPGAAGSDTNRRTSDYFSDSGGSSYRPSLTDSEQKIDEISKSKRQAEQDRARMKVEISDRVQEELSKRRSLEATVRSLEDQLQGRKGPELTAGSERIRELETTVESMRRQLADERSFKDNFEDIMGGLRHELEQTTIERDNLRDQVTPQLRARLQTLEAESSRGQQELQNLRNENSTLVNARRTAMDMQGQSSRFMSIAEENDTGARVGLSRSNTTTRNSLNGARRGSLSRSGSVKGRGEAQENVSADRLKGIEDQRDALHRALKSLLERHELQQRDHVKQIKLVELERDRVLSMAPKRNGFHKEVTQLREEVNVLRRRADDALEQKWQCEKGLSGLKFDLDRAEQETSSLRNLLQDRNLSSPSKSDKKLESVPLEKAVNELRASHALSMVVVKDLEAGRNGGSDSAHVLELLKQSISEAEAEREAAQNEAQNYREQARALQKSEVDHLNKEKSLSSELYASATRMDELASQVQQQLQSNKELRTRLAEAIGRGEQDQQSSASRISELQGRLRSLEDKLMNAQQHSEDVISGHEQEVKQIRESQNIHLLRARKSHLSPGAASPATPGTPFMMKSPKLDRTSSGPGMSLFEATKNQALESRVTELEVALADADSEMQEVICRMNTAQIEVADLQTQRDEANRQTRKLQAQILAEREKVKALTS